MPALPTGTVTFLLSDVVGSAALWESHRLQMLGALARHDELARVHVEGNDGRIVKPRGEGDSLFCVFSRAADALRAALDWQCALLLEPWPDGISLRVRLALYTGEAECDGDDYRGLAPSRCARLRALAGGGQILLSEATQALALETGLPPGASLRDWGRHALRGLTRTEQIFQILHPDLPDEAVPLLSRPHNLPPALTSLVGRQNDVQKIAECLSQARLVTLTGPGGVGKTRLALRVAEETLARFPGGAWLVELAALSAPETLPQAVARTLQIPEIPGQPMNDALREALKSQNLLLIIDNCEHLLDAAAHLCDTLLRVCPDLHILATSREPLSITGEFQWPVSCLPLPRFRLSSPPETLLENESVRLFIERARAKMPTFRLDVENAPSVARLCRKLDGLPLDLELVAAWVRTMPVGRIADELERGDRLRMLSRGERTAAPRQQSARAGVEFSYALLPENERRLLRRVSVFVGGWTEEDAIQICADEKSENGTSLTACPDWLKNRSSGARKITA